MRKSLIWIAGAFSFLALVIAFAPARIVPQLITAPEVRLNNPEGTLWDGSVRVSHRNQFIGTLSWDVHFLVLFKGQLSVDYVLVGHDVALAGVLEADHDTRALTADGTLNSSLANSYLLDYDMRLAGRLTVNDVKVSMSASNQVQALQGNVSWEGGPVRYKLLNTVTEVELQPLAGTLINDGTSIYVNLTELHNAKPILTLHLEQATGWLHIQAFPDFLEFADVPASYLIEDAKFLFEVSHQIYH